MTKKLMLLAAGALTALAFAALPMGASAVEMTATCSAVPCVGTIEITGFVELTDDSGLGIRCDKTGGTVTQAASPSSTVTATITFSECNETAFSTECNNEGAGTKKIVTNTLTGHFITIVTNSTNGILLTGFNITFECPLFGIKKTVTGNLIGTLENKATVCGKAVTTHTIEFTEEKPGFQTHRTWTGKTFDLTSGTHAADTTTFSTAGTTHLNWGAKTVNIAC